MTILRLFGHRLTLALLLCITLKVDAETLDPLKEDLNVGFYYPSIQSQVSRADFEVSLTLLLKELTQKVEPLPIKVVMFDTTDAMRRAFDAGELALIVGPPFILAKYFSRESFAEDGMAGTTTNGKPNGLIVVTRNDKHLNSIHDIRGKRVVLPLDNEFAEFYLDHLTLQTFKQPLQKIFSAVQYKSQNSAVLYDVFFDRADVALTLQETYNLMGELNPQINSRIKVLTSYPFKSPNYGFFHKRYPEHLRKIWLAGAFKLQSLPRVRLLFDNLKMGGLISCPLEELKPFDQLIESYTKLKQGVKKLKSGSKH